MTFDVDEQLSELPPHAYLQQTARAYRFLDRYTAARVSMRGVVDGPTFNDVEDFMWAFFQNCWHIKDWLRHDFTVDEKVRATIVAAAESEPDLRVVADLANGSKHFARDLKRERTGAYDGAVEFRDGAHGTVTVEHMIVFLAGQRVSAVELGIRAMRAWQRLFEEAGLHRFVDPPSSPSA